METAIKKFWTYFVSIQKNLIGASSVSELGQHDKFFNRLSLLASRINSKMEIIVHLKSLETQSASLIFLSKGNYRLKAIAEIIISQAPKLEPWKYCVGLKPYNHSVIKLCANYNFIDSHTAIFQIYFAVKKVYKSNNKLQLLIYLEIDKPHSKQNLHQAMDKIFLWFLGDSLYYRHISRFKILRRKYAANHFIHLDELKTTLLLRPMN